MTITLLRNIFHDYLIKKNYTKEKNLYSTEIKFDPITTQLIVNDAKKIFLKIKSLSNWMKHVLKGFHLLNA